MISTILYAVLFVISFILYILWQKNRPANYPPGPTNWFGIGCSVAMHKADPVYPHEALRKLSRIYGPIMSISLGVHRAVIFSKYEDILEIFTKDEFVNRYQFPFALDRTDNKNLGILMTCNDAWQAVRTFSVKSLRDSGFRNTTFIGTVVRENLNDVLVQLRKESAAQDGIIHFESNFTASVAEVMCHFVFGFRSEEYREILQRFFDTIENTAKALAFDNVNLAYPFLRKLVPWLTGFKRDMAVFKEHKDIFKELIAIANQRKDDVHNSHFLRAFQKEIAKNVGNPNTHFTDEQLIITLADMFLAGSETVTHFIGFAVLHIVRNPQMQHKVYKEACTVVAASDDVPTYGDAERMPYTQAFMYEVFRYCNIVPIPLARTASRNYEYKGLMIPKGTCIMYNLHCVFNDPDYWGDPENFRPERFLDAGGNLTKTERVIVFGLGKRICIGDVLAKQACFVYLAGLVKKFKFEQVPGQPKPTDTPRSHFTSRPTPFDALVTPRE